MHSKGLVEREEYGRGHLYRPKVNQQETQKSLVTNFMDLAFGGSAKKLVMQALGQ
jgi:predicted transcriptional regulator